MAAGGTPANLDLGPGRLYYAPLATAAPTDCSTAMPSAWKVLGYTEAGTTITFDMTVEGIKVAEELDDVLTINTGRTTTLEAEIVEMTRARLALVMGSGVTAESTTVYSPPTAGTEISVSLVWDKLDTPDNTNRRYYFPAARASGTVAMKRQKAPNKASLPVTFKCAKTATSEAFQAFANATFGV